MASVLGLYGLVVPLLLFFAIRYVFNREEGDGAAFKYGVLTDAFSRKKSFSKYYALIYLFRAMALTDVVIFLTPVR